MVSSFLENKAALFIKFESTKKYIKPLIYVINLPIKTARPCKSSPCLFEREKGQ